MTPDEWSQVQSWFHDALEMSATVRASELAKIESESPLLAREVRSLLAAHDSVDSFLEKPVATTAVKFFREHLTAEDIELEEGQVIGKFRIDRFVAAGGLARVYLATDLELDRQVALKVAVQHDDEAQLLANLEHDHIVTVFSQQVLKSPSLNLLCMQYIPGVDLQKVLDIASEGEERIESGADLLKIVERFGPPVTQMTAEQFNFQNWFMKLSVEEAVMVWLEQICSALSHAHDQGILHLDVKPGNILIHASGRALLTDFNVSSRRKGVKVRGGSYAYMAPEQMSATTGSNDTVWSELVENIDERADLYSVGVILQRFLISINPEGERLKLIASKATSFDRALRYTNANEMGKALRQARSLFGHMRRRSADSIWLGWLRDHPLLCLVGSILVPNIIGSLFNILYNSSQIVSRLSTLQQVVFHDTLPPFNGLIFGSIMAVGIWNFRYLNGFLLTGGFAMKPLTAQVLRTPQAWGRYTTLGWGVGAIFWPVMLFYVGGGISLATVIHFGISFPLSWLIAMTYSLLLLQYVCVRILLPKVLMETLSEVPSREQLWALFHPQRLRYLAGGIPLVCAMLVIWLPSSTESQKILMSCFIALGILGLVAANRITDAIAGDLRVWTSRQG